MTEIRIDVDLPHPQERVWKGLTDPVIVRQWFMGVEVDPDHPRRFTLRPAGEAGFDEPIAGEIVESVTPRRLVARWHSPQLHTTLTVTLHPIVDGCRVTVVQRGFLGPQGTLRRRLLQRTYREMLDSGLRQALARLAAEERERAIRKRRQAGVPAGRREESRRNDARFPYVPRQASAALAGLLAAGRNVSRLWSSPQPGRSSRRRPTARGVAPPAGEALRESPTTRLVRSALAFRRPAWRGGATRRRPRRPGVVGGNPRLATAMSAVILVLLAVLAVLVDRIVTPGGPGASAGGEQDPHGVLVPGGQGAAVTSETAVGPPPLRSASPTVQPPSATLAASYRTEQQIVGGYQAVITINNLSSQVAYGWTVRIVLPPLGLVVHAVQGAEVEQTEKEVRFFPRPETRVVPAGQSVRFTFQIQGVGAPIECTIIDLPCSGIPE